MHIKKIFLFITTVAVIAISACKKDSNAINNNNNINNLNNSNNINSISINNDSAIKQNKSYLLAGTLFLYITYIGYYQL